MDYDYHTASAAANRAIIEETKATNTLKTLIRRLAKITPKPSTASYLKLPQADAPPRKMPVAMAEKDRERSRATIERLLASYVRHKRGIPRATSATPPPSRPAEMGQSDPIQADMPHSRNLTSDGQSSRDLDVTMAESTVTFGNTMRMGESKWRIGNFTTLRR